MVMRVFNNFLFIKSEDEQVQNREQDLAQMIKLIQKSWIGHLKMKLEIDLSLISKSLKELVDLVQIEDLANYLILSNFYLHKGRKSGNIELTHRNKTFSIEIIKKEQKDILCCKTKRKEELNKFSLKFVRKELLKQFKTGFREGFSDKKLKSLFYKRFLDNRPDGIDAFESLDLPKKYMMELKNYSFLVDQIKIYNQQKFIEAVVSKYIMGKVDFLTSKFISIKTFIDEILSRQHINSISIQSVLNALEQFIIFFED